MFWRISWSLERYLRHTLPSLVSPDRILEFGPGRSTKVFAETFPQAGIVSLEHQEPFYRRHLEAFQHLPQVQVFHCPLDSSSFYSSGAWEGLAYDLILVDGPPKKMKPQVRGGASRIFHQLTPGGIVILDDSHRADEKAIVSRWIEQDGLQEIHSGSSFTVLRKPAAVLSFPGREAVMPVLQEQQVAAAM